ncbi:acyl-CoA dehydrogenase [Limoniibacter endophyticus]|uniref:3-methylmercaptopropionyl-CoA dehydrogenase n=1 Tax=Limoniibacter endophyticus TaxID=1565040 RepID=A0A8J3DMQ5_9HYPH|nr:acyl-CoA dehydrogenase [Limoniibacter endophyticus]GHC71408.1 acyl-CoA dehydrogenase [Limoniibacter endophyticus]
MYRAPVDEIAFALRHHAGLSQVLGDGVFSHLDDDVLDAIMGEAGRFASEEIAPLNLSGDREGAKLANGAITTPKGWKEAYAHWREGGWNGLSAPEAYGGQDLPLVVNMAAFEMWASASVAFALGPTLTMGGIEALAAHGSPELQKRYLEKLVSGEWMATMNLTEPQAGSDLSTVRTKAVPEGDGTYRLSGQKIFITFGEHDFTDNIVHLVLARLPDAPEGTRGISLFLVPKFLVNEDGTLGKRNDVICSGVEHKMGIHGSPTCTMVYGDGGAHSEVGTGAIGWLVGEENRGLNCMFTMMNNARVAIGAHGVGLCEAATQKALEYARERRQGKAKAVASEGAVAILHHADIQRELLTMKALTAASRALVYSCALAIDLAHANEDTEKKKYWQERANLLTPLAKAFSSDNAVEVTGRGVQVHGGMGFIEETGAAVFYRDARIGTIYEGTNGIQAIDLVMRKLPQSGGQHVLSYIGELSEQVDAFKASGEATAEVAARLSWGLDQLRDATVFLQEKLQAGDEQPLMAAATPYLRLFSIVLGAVLLSRGVTHDPEGQSPLLRFYAENLLAEAAGLKDRVIHGAASLDEAAKLLWKD